MTKANILAHVRAMARTSALELQSRAGGMTGTELYSEKLYIPEFAAAKAKANMLTRGAGFTCRSGAGRVVRLLQPYDSGVYTGEPEELPAQWGFKWSSDPEEALPFIALATSPYSTGDCCTEGGRVFRSREDNNVFSPGLYPAGWEDVI